MSSGSKGKSLELSRRYSAALREQLTPTTGTSPQPAESLAREALVVGMDMMDLVRIHVRALITLLPPGPSSRRSDGMIRRAASFFVEVLTPIENARRAAVELNGQSSRVKPTARKKPVELVAARKRLQHEIDSRRALHQALKASERHYRELLDKSRTMQEHLRQLSREILLAHEEERKKISRELHDEIGQTLTAINVKLATLNKEATVNSVDLKKKIASTQRLLEKSMSTVHRFARELRPPLLDDLGLIPALHSCMKEFTRRTDIPVHFKTFAEVEKLDSDKRTVLYRVAQEAFSNVAKHAEASLVTVTIKRLRGAVQIEIRDNGKSFDAERVLHAKRIRRLGLLGMRERVEMVGGSFSVESEPDRGTTIRAQIPFGNGRNGRRALELGP